MLHKINNDKESEVCVALLHGFGADENDLFDLRQLFPESHVVSFQAPIDLSSQGYFGGRAWFNLDFTPYGIEYDKAGLQKAISLVTEEVRLLRERFSKLYLCGFSQGAILTHAVFLNNEVEIDGIAGLSGRYSEDIFQDELKANITGKPVFLSHGTQDDVIPISSGRKIIDFYKSSQAKLFFSEYKMGHGIDMECQRDIQKWFKNI